MTLVLDSDTIIFFLKGRDEIVSRMGRANPDDLATTRINHSELLFGAYHSQRVEENLKKFKTLFADLIIYEYDEKASELFAQQKADLKRKGSMIADMDLMIASICLANEAHLVTNNLRHFERIEGLTLETWLK